MSKLTPLQRNAAIAFALGVLTVIAFAAMR